MPLITLYVTPRSRWVYFHTLQLEHPESIRGIIWFDTMTDSFLDSVSASWRCLTVWVFFHVVCPSVFFYFFHWKKTKQKHNLLPELQNSGRDFKKPMFHLWTFESTFHADIFKALHSELKSLTHRTPQTPGWWASRRLGCAAGCFPECPGQSEDSYTGGSRGCTRTSSRCSGTQTGLQIYSRCSRELPGWTGSAGSLVGWPAALWRKRDC